MTHSLMIDKWKDEFLRHNSDEVIGRDPDFVEFTEMELLELFASWLQLQVSLPCFRRIVETSDCIPDCHGGFTYQLELDAQEAFMFPTLVVDVDKRGFIHICRLGEHADTIVTATINNLEKNPAIELLFEEFL